MRFNYEWEGVFLDIEITFLDDGHDYYFDHIYLKPDEDGDPVEIDIQNIITVPYSMLPKVIDSHIWSIANEYAANARQEALEDLL